MTKFDPADIMTVAEHEADFAQSEYGQWVINQLAVQYNNLHHEAEREGLNAESKAFYVERAAGVKVAIDLLTANAAALESGALDDREVEPS